MTEPLQLFICGRRKRNFRFQYYYVINILNLNISVIYCRIKIYLGLVITECRWHWFRKNALFYVTFGLIEITSLSFQLRISLLFYVGLSHNLVREIWDIHETLSSNEILCDLERYLCQCLCDRFHIWPLDSPWWEEQVI